MKQPAAVMGTIYVGTLQLKYDVSGGTVVIFTGGLRVVFLPDMRDASLYVQAEAMGYGRQIGQLVRDRVLMHCLLAHIEDGEPLYMVTGQPWPWLDRVDMLVCQLNQVAGVKCDPSDVLPLTMAKNLLQGGGIHA